MKPRFTIPRMASWRGGSEAIREIDRCMRQGVTRDFQMKPMTIRIERRVNGISAFMSTVRLAWEENCSGCFSTCITSSWREMAKASDSGAQWTGASSRRRR